MIPFLTRPGVLSRKYVDGEKARYIVPFRMFMFFSVLFFLVSGWLRTEDPNVDSTSAINEISASLDTLWQNINVSTPVDSLNLNTDTSKSISSIDSLRVLRTDFGFSESINFARSHPQLPAADALYKMGVTKTQSNISKYDLITKSVRMNPSEFINEIRSHFALLIFLFMPILAIMLKLFYMRRNIYYSEHLTFLLQSNSMVFLLSLFAILLDYYVNFEMAFLVWLLFTIYFLIAMKNFYRQGWIKTIVKFILVGLSYIFLVPLFSIISVAIIYIFY